MTDSKRPAHFRFSADRQSGQRTVRYQEGTQVDANDCSLCALDQAQPFSEPSMAIDEQDDEQLAASVLAEAIENQLQTGEPPATQAVLNKLTLVGYPREESIALMTQVLAYCIGQLKADQPFDLPLYEQLLRALPELPDDLAT